MKNIPTGLGVDYKQELSKIFTHYSVPNQEIKIVVTKVVLVYDLQEINEKEEELKKLIKEKQRILRGNG